MDGTYIQNGSLTNAHISASAAIALSKLATGTSGQLAIVNGSGNLAYATQSGDVTFSNSGVSAIGTGKVLTAMIADSNVTTAKIADANVTTAKILDSNVTTGKINDSAVTTAKLNDGAVTSAKITDGTIATADLADNVVTSRKLSATADILSTSGTTALTPSNSDKDIITMGSDITPSVNCTVFLETSVLYSSPSAQANMRVRIYESTNSGSSYTLVSDETSDPLTTAPSGNYSQIRLALKRSLTASTTYRWKVTAASVTGVGNVTQNSATYFKYEILK